MRVNSGFSVVAGYLPRPVRGIRMAGNSAVGRFVLTCNHFACSGLVRLGMAMPIVIGMLFGFSEVSGSAFSARGPKAETPLGLMRGVMCSDNADTALGLGCEMGRTDKALTPVGLTCKMEHGNKAACLGRDRDLRVKQVNLIIRDLGHRLLLQAGDITSRVLPVTEVTEGTFLLEFENEFVFNHDSLVSLTESLLPRAQFPSGYTVTVHECITARIVYGFQINNFLPDIMACRGRLEPPGCYTIEIALPDLLQNAEAKKVEFEQPFDEQRTSPSAHKNANPKPEAPEALKVSLPETSAKQQALMISNTVPQKVNAEEFQKTTLDYPVINFIYSGALVVLGVTLLIGRFGKNIKRATTTNHAPSIIKEPTAPLPALGKFLFDVSGQRLLFGSEVISLTEKECKILELLHAHFGELVSRETLMQKIWIDEGVITGRSLDMFISKLRKKLSGDAEVKITNVHGKGYVLQGTCEG